jgi:D-arabinose 1-dehydrogenase-like Zn-dependent alcohol dehydrogenase
MQRRSAVWWTRAAPAQAARRVTSNFGEHFPILTYNGEDKPLGGVTYGGYSESIVVDEGFVLKVSENLNLAAVTPLLCAGITTYSPLRHWKLRLGTQSRGALRSSNRPRVVNLFEFPLLFLLRKRRA